MLDLSDYYTVLDPLEIGEIEDQFYSQQQAFARAQITIAQVARTQQMETMLERSNMALQDAALFNLYPEAQQFFLDSDQVRSGAMMGTLRGDRSLF